MEEEEKEGEVELVPNIVDANLTVNNLELYRYARTTRTFLTSERTGQYNKLYYSEGDDSNHQKFVYLNMNIAPRVLTNACQINMSCFLSFCLRYEIYVEGIPNLYMAGKHRLNVKNKSLYGIETPLSVPSYLFVFAYKVCVLCQRYRQLFSALDDFKTLSPASLNNNLEQEHRELYTLLSSTGLPNPQTRQPPIDVTGQKEITTFPIRDPNRYNDFIRQEELFDRTKDAHIWFDWCELGWILFKEDFNPAIITDDSSLEPWTECVSLVNDRAIPPANIDVEDVDILGHFRMHPDEFAELTYDDLSLVIPVDHFIFNTDQQKASLDFFVIVPTQGNRLPLPCIEIADPRINFRNNDAYGIYVNKKIRSSMRASIEDYFVTKFTSLSEDRLRSITIRSFLMQKDNDSIRREILSRSWPNASLISLDMIHLLEKCKPLCDFKILRETEIADISNGKGLMVYNGKEVIGRNETISLSLCHSLRVPAPNSREVVFCFTKVDQLVEFLRYLFFLSIEYEIFLPLCGFLKEIFEVYGLHRYFPLYQIDEIRAYWIPRLERRIQSLSLCGLYTTTGAPVLRKLQLFKLGGISEEERQRLTKVVQKTTLELNEAMKSSKNEDLSISMERINMLKTRIDNAKQSLQEGYVETNRMTSDPFKHLYQSAVNQSGVQSKNVLFNEPLDQDNDLHLIDTVNKKMRESEERMSSSLFDNVINANQGSLITNLIEEKKELSLKERLKKMKGPIAIFMLIVSGSVPNMTLDMLYLDYPEDVNSFESHYQCFNGNCHKALAELNETIIKITNKELNLFSMFHRTGLERFKSVSAELASIYLLDIIGSSTYKSMFNGSKTNITKGRILLHLKECWQER